MASPVQETFEKGLMSPAVDKPASSKRCCSAIVVGNTCIGIGVLVALFGVIYGTVLPHVANKTIDDGVASCKLSDYQKDSFLDPYGDCKDCNQFTYVFNPYNVTNAEQVLQGAKAQLHETGPYAYRKRLIRKDVEFKGDTVSYRAYSYFTFDTAKSCAGCSPNDTLTVFDLSYLVIMNGAGGETNFLKTMLKATPTGANLTDELMDMQIKMGGPILLKLMYGYNSLNAEAMKNLGTKAALALAKQDLPTLMALTMEGFAYNGMFKKLTVQQEALGHPSILVGTLLGKNYLDNCVKGGLNDKCASCQGEECTKIASDCTKCTQGAEIHASNERSCSQIESIYAAAYGTEEAAEFVAGTCKTCALTGFCAAQIYGNLEATGFDWSNEVPPARFWSWYTQRTGCDDKDHIGDYVVYKNASSTALYVKSNDQKNPTAMELMSFHGDCKNKDSNVTCVEVSGGDGSAVRPSGVSMSGMPATSDVEYRNIYVASGYQNVTVYRTKEKHSIKGINVIRYRPEDDLLYQHPWNANRGTGVPFRGLQSLSYNYGFLAYLSFPFFAWGEPSLLENVQLTRHDGTKMTTDVVYDKNGQVKPDVRDQYSTFLDVEPATGKAMRVVNRCQASIAINKSPSVEGAALSDILFPKVQTEMVWPLFWGEESVVISDHNADRFKSELVVMTKTFLPVFIAGLVLGLALLGFGVFHRIRATRAMKTTQVAGMV